MQTGVHCSLLAVLEVGESTGNDLTLSRNLCCVTLLTLGACHNSFLVFVSNRSRSGIAENWSQIRYVAILVP
jgi:hypothetical protein